MAAQAAALGLPPEVAAGLLASARAAVPATIEVMPENWDAMRIFLAMGTQWRRAGWVGVATGLDYAALPVVSAALDVPAGGDLFARLRILEGAALAAMAEAR